MDGKHLPEVIAAVHDALHHAGLIDAGEDHGDDEQRRDDDHCIALGGQLVMELQAHGLDVAKRRPRRARQ